MAKSQVEQIRDLVTDVRVLTERDESRRREVERLTAKVESLQVELAAEREERAALKQQLHEYVKRADLWDGRRWTVVLALLAAVLGLASGLVIALVKK